MLNACSIYFVLILIFDASCQLIREDDYPSDWINPSDMSNFQQPSKEKSQEPEIAPDVSDEKPEELHEPNEDTDVEKVGSADPGDGQQVSDESSNLSQSCKHPMLKRFVSVLNGHLRALGESVDIERYEMSLKIGHHKRSALQEYSQNCQQNVNEILDILEKMIENIHVKYRVSWKRKFEDVIGMQFQDFLKLAFAAFITISILTLEVVGQVAWMTQLKRLFVIGIFVSIGMTYYHEIKVTEAEFKAKSHQLSWECMNDLNEMSYFSGLKMIYRDWFSTETVTDHCKEFYETFLIHPKLKVTPTKVIAITFTRFAVEPMEHMGIAFSKAFKNMFAGLPITLWIPAFVFVLVVVLGCILIIAVLFGYNFNINLPFWAGLQIAPPPPPLPQPILHNAENENRLQDEILRLRDRIEDLQFRPQQEALPPAPAYQENRRYSEIPPHNPPGYYSRSETLPYPEPDYFASGDASRERNRQRNTGLRRRHTYTAEVRGGREDHNLPYPTIEEDVRPTETLPQTIPDPLRMNEGIGFEPLVQHLTEAQVDEAPEVSSKQQPMARDGNIQELLTQRHNSDKPVVSEQKATHGKASNREIENACNSNSNNVNSYSKVGPEDLGCVDEEELKDEQWVQVASIGNSPDDVDGLPFNSEPSLNQFTKEAEAGFNLDSLK